MAGAEPIHGLYVSLFPVVIYAIFGGSKQISIGMLKNYSKTNFLIQILTLGTFAVISIACRDVVEQIIGNELANGNQSIQNVTISNNLSSIGSLVYETAEHLPIEEKITSVEVLTSLCLLVGIIQVTNNFLFFAKNTLKIML